MNATRRLAHVAAAALVLLVTGAFGAASASASITITSPTAGSFVNDSTPSFSGTTDDLLDGVTLKIYAGKEVDESSLVQTTTTLFPPTGGTWALDATASLSDDVYTAQASQTNILGETVSSEPPVTFSIDTTPPALSMSPAATPTNDSTPSFGGSAGSAAGDNDLVTLRIYPGEVASGSPIRTVSVTPNSGTWAASPDEGLGDGTYTVQAEQSDEAGNTGTSSPATFTVDTAAPAVSLTPVTSPTNDATPSFGGSAGVATGDIASVTLKIYSGTSPSGSPVRTLHATPSGATWTTTSGEALGDGTYTAQAEQSDEATNTVTSAPSTFTVDTTPPAVQITSPANGSFVNSSKPTLSGTAGSATGDQTTVTVKIYAGSSVSGSPTQEVVVTRSGASWTTGTSGPQLLEGTYTVQAEQSDEAGNTGTSSPSTFTIKTKGPAVSLTPVTSPTNDATPSFGGSAGVATGDIASVTLKIYSGTSPSGSPVRTLHATPSGATWTTTSGEALGDGTYTAQAEQSDEATNTVTSAPSTFTVDTTPPAVQITSPANGSFVNSSKPTLSGTAGSATGDQTTVTVKIYAGSSVSGSPTQEVVVTRSGASWTTGTSGPQLLEGTYTVQAEQSDEAGNTGTSAPSTFTIKTKGPAVSLTPVTSPTNDATPSFGGSAGVATGDIASVTLKIYSGTSPSGSPVRTLHATPSGASWAATPAEPLGDGTYTAQAEQSDKAGDTDTSAPSTFTVDTTRPVVQITSPANGSFLKSSKPTLSGTAGSATGDQTSVTLKIYVGSSVSGIPATTLGVTRSGASWTTGTSGPQLLEGTYTVQAEQSDEAGNTGTSAPSTFTIKTKGPAVSLTPVTSPTNDATPSFGGSAGVATGDIASVTLKIYSGTSPSGSPVRTTLVAPSGASWAATPAEPLGDGTYTAQAEQSDKATNTVTSAPSTFTVDTTRPAVQITSPANGSFLKTSKPTLSGTAGSAPGDQTSVTLKIYVGSSVSGIPATTLGVTRSGASWTTGTSGPQLLEGTYTVQAEQSDEAGNTGTSAPSTFTIKTKGPAVSLTPVTSPTNDATPSFGGSAGVATGDIASVTLKIYSGTSPSGSPVRTLHATPSGASWAATPAEPFGDGTYTARAEQSDKATNTVTSAPSTFTVDTVAPTPSLSPGPSERRTSTPQFEGNAGLAAGDIPSLILNIYSGAGVSGSPVRQVQATLTAGKWKAAPSAALGNGQYTAQAEQSDEAGNTGTSTASEFTIKSKGPVVTLSPPPREMNDSTPNFSGSAGVAAGDLASVRLKIYAGTVASGNDPVREVAVTPTGGTWTSGPVQRLEDGTYTVLAEQSNNVGNTGVSPEATFTVDTTPPAITMTAPATGGSTTSGSQVVAGAAGTAAGDTPTITVTLYAGPAAGSHVLETRVVQASGGRWQVAFEGLAAGPYTAQGEQSDEAGNEGRTEPATFTVTPTPSAAGTAQAPSASFTWLPSSPHAGEAVSLFSSSTDSASPITAFAWDPLGNGPFKAGQSTASTSFATPGNHVVRLRVSAADGLSSVATEAIPVKAAVQPLMRPFPSVRIISTDTRRGIRLKLLKVQASAGAQITVTCRGRGCPVKSLKRLATSANAGVSAYTFVRLQRSLRAGVVLEIRVSKSGEIGKYTRLTVRRSRLPQRVDLCLDPGGVKPIACPS